MTISTRPMRVEDAAVLAELVTVNRQFMAPFEPVREESYFTEAGQRELIAGLLKRDNTVAHVILDGDRAVGRITLNDIVRGPFLNCHLGYWVNAADNGRGIAGEAARQMIQHAFGELGLHRIQAGTLVDNYASQRVLARHGFVRFGLAPQYLNIAGRWQDHILFQLIAPS